MEPSGGWDIVEKGIDRPQLPESPLGSLFKGVRKPVCLFAKILLPVGSNMLLVLATLLWGWDPTVTK